MGQSSEFRGSPDRLAPRVDEGNEKLWSALSAFTFDEPNIPYPFSRRLAKRSKWSHDYALKVIEEYRKFLYLMQTAGHMVTPSLNVDEVWHLHLIYTESYWQDLCMGIYGKPMHHHPGDGSDEDAVKFAAIYERTLDDYTNVFGTPPASVWGKRNESIDWRAVLAKTGSAPPRTKQGALLTMLGTADVSSDSPPPLVLAKEHEPFWAQLQAFQFDKVGAPYPFSKRLAKRNNWSHEYALRVIDEYRKFMYLLKVTGHWVTPSTEVDEAWHLHLMYTFSYWELLCMGIFKQPVHHFPGDGSNEEQDKAAATYGRTLDYYAQYFGEPPQDIWRRPVTGFDWRKTLAKFPVIGKKFAPQSMSGFFGHPAEEAE